MSKSWPLFPFQKHGFNEESFTRSEIMIDCNIFLVTETANENRWQTYVYQQGKKELANVNVTKEMNSDSLNVSLINTVWISVYSLYVHKKSSSENKTIVTKWFFIPFPHEYEHHNVLGRKECAFIHLDTWKREVD